MFNKRSIIQTVTIFIIACLVIAGCSNNSPSPQEPPANNTGVDADGNVAVPQIPEVSVSMGMAPFGDQTWASVGMDHGFFKEAGITITPEPAGRIITSDQRIAALVAGTVDIMTGHVGTIAPVHKNAPNLKFFASSNVFEGYAILAQPDSGFKTYQEILAEEGDQATALNKTMAQLVGKRYAHAQSSALISFIQSALGLGGVSMSDVDTIPLDDPEVLSTMLTGRADFGTAGAPQRAMLESTGYYPIFSGADLATIAEPSPESKELEGLLVAGWVSTDEFLEKNHDTILRLSGVFYRTLDLLVNEQEKSLAIHLPFLNSVSGMELTSEALKVLYDSLNPFYTFEMQSDWYENPDNIYYYENEIGAKLRSYVEQGIFSEGEISIDDVSVAHKIYFEMKSLKEDSEALIAEVKSASGATEQTNELLEQAEYWLNAYNFLDAHRFAEAAKMSLK